MKKKDLYEQNTVLYNRLQTANAELKKYKELYAQNISEINSLRQALAEMELDIIRAAAEEKEQKETAEEVLEPALPEPIVDVSLEVASQYGAEVIGRIVMEGTQINNTFAGSSNELTVDLINLVLGKTEVCKADIYDICRKELTYEQKKSEIDAVYKECIDYFVSLSKQL